MCGAQHVKGSTPYAPNDPKRHLLLSTINKTMNKHQRTYVDGTATILTAHQGLQSLCPFFGGNQPAERYELMSCCINRCHSRIVTETVWNNKHKNEEQSGNATRVSLSEMIHTNVEGLFQQLLTTFATGTGKRYWSTTSGRDETSCHNSTSASKLASCLSFSRDAIKTRGNQSSFTNANEKPNMQMSQT